MAVGREGGRSGGAAKAPRVEIPRAKRVGKEEGRHGARTPERPRVREAERERLAASSGVAREEGANTPTRQLRRQAAEKGLLPGGSPVRFSPRPESPRAPASPPGNGSPRGAKRRAPQEEAGHASPQRKKMRIEPRAGGMAMAPGSIGTAPDPVEASPAPDAVPTPGKAAASSKEMKVFRTFVDSGLKGLLRMDRKTPSSEDLRRDPDDEDFECREARLPNGLSFLFSRGAIPGTVLDSTTEEPDRQQGAGAPESEAEKG